MPPPTVPSEISSPLTDISGANTPLPPITFLDQKEKKNLRELPNTLQGDNIRDQPGNSR